MDILSYLTSLTKMWLRKMTDILPCRPSLVIFSSIKNILPHRPVVYLFYRILSRRPECGSEKWQIFYHVDLVLLIDNEENYQSFIVFTSSTSRYLMCRPHLLIKKWWIFCRILSCRPVVDQLYLDNQLLTKMH